MTDEEFWALIRSLGGVADERTVARLCGELGDLAAALQQRVDEMVRALDGSRLQGLLVGDVSDPPGVEPLPLTGTALENLLLAVVAAGPDVYGSVRADPAVVTTRRWSFSEADRLGRVFEEIAGPPGWCRPLVFGSAGHWLSYADAVHEIATALDARDDWRSWWAVAGRERLDLVIELTDDDSGAVRTGGRIVRADFRFPLQRLLHRPPGVTARLAAEDVTRIMQAVAVKLRLSAPPATPWPAVAEPEDPRSADRAARLKALRRKHR
ncbi:hypothetical protein ACN27F_10000 [Solwaraspora sp. WMMB335]|uniref:hypothetical protein n=1 Tax=Solwaraspora sp. WMMB335 TaxID=3404118 RepID=UPI003B95E82E